MNTIFAYNINKYFAKIRREAYVFNGICRSNCYLILIRNYDVKY